MTTSNEALRNVVARIIAAGNHGDPWWWKEAFDDGADETAVRLRKDDLAVADDVLAALDKPAHPVFVPGVLRCAKCEFRLVKTTLNIANGTASANNEPDTCPNCNVPMWRLSWEDEAREAYKVAESQMDRAIAAEQKLKEPHLVLLPDDMTRLMVMFAKAADFTTERDRRIYDAIFALQQERARK